MTKAPATSIGGESLAAVCAELNITRTTLYEWRDTQPDFKDAIERGLQKAQQVWFIKLIGTNVNLGNIAPAEVIPLETIRIGLRGDTFSHFLDMKQA